MPHHPQDPDGRNPGRTGKDARGVDRLRDSDHTAPPPGHAENPGAGRDPAGGDLGPVPPVSPRHPSDDAMPPYAPGGVPEPSRDPAAQGRREGPTFPPKSKP